MIPAEAFIAIESELLRQPLPDNQYRTGAGVGKSQAFLVVGRRCIPPDYSRLCWSRPYLTKLLMDFGKKYITDLSWNAITVNQNYVAKKHKDKRNVGESLLVAFGDYTGGQLKIHEGDLSGTHDVRHKPLITDFSKVYHSVEPFEGTRFSLVFYQYDMNFAGQEVVLPPPSVRYEKNQWRFYRGDQLLNSKNRLSHPLMGRKNREAPEEPSPSHIESRQIL
jgi:hypothetical protein